MNFQLDENPLSVHKTTRFEINILLRVYHHSHQLSANAGPNDCILCILQSRTLLKNNQIKSRRSLPDLKNRVLTGTSNLTGRETSCSATNDVSRLAAVDCDDSSDPSKATSSSKAALER